MLLLLAVSALAVPLDRSVDHALAVHVPPGGLATLGDAVEAIAPKQFDVEATTDAFLCSDSTALIYTLDPVSALLSVDEVAIVPSDDRLDVTLYATLTSTASTLTVAGDCGVLEDLDEVCDLQIPTTAVEVSLGVAIDQVGGAIEATADPVVLTVAPIGNPLGNCTLSSGVGAALGQDELLINGFLLDAVDGELDGVPALVEDAIEDAFAELVVDTEVDVLGTPLGLVLEPSTVEVSDAGLLVGFAADLYSETGGCVDATGYPESATTLPVLGDTAPGSSLAYDAGILLSRGFAEDLALALWGTGILCMELDELEGVPLRGSLVSAFFGTAIGELIGEDTPVVLALDSPVPPDVVFDDDQPVVGMVPADLTLALYAPLDYREARILSVEVEAEAGVDLGLIGGTIAPTLVIDEGALLFREQYFELVDAGYSANLGELVDTILGTALPDEALAEVTLPEPLGIRVDEVVWLPVPDDSWLGGYALLDLSGVQAIELDGCGGDAFSCDGGGGTGIEFDLEDALGCDDPTASGCGDASGCSSGRVWVPTWPLPVLLALVLAALRRREA